MIRLASCLAVLGLALGCGRGDLPDMGYVTGNVTMDGNPLPHAVVVFQPEHARPSYGRTDENGDYELYYSDAKGAVIGTHAVKIRCSEGLPEADSEVEDEEYGAAGVEIVPAKYNHFTELTADVKAGSQTFDWKLDSEGEVIQDVGR